MMNRLSLWMSLICYQGSRTVHSRSRMKVPINLNDDLFLLGAPYPPHLAL